MAQAAVTHEAIMFFSDNEIVKEMLYPEFEAVLDQYVGMFDFENQTMKAAYLQINGQLQITAVVLFIISFEKGGYVAQDWNIPLQQLADKAAEGPDLGAGPIRLCSSSQCPISWHQSMLWDPLQSAGVSTYDALTKAVEKNNLLLTKSGPASPGQGKNPPVLNTQVGGESSVSGMDAEALKRELREQFEAEFDGRVSTAIATAQGQQDQQISNYSHQVEELQEALAAAKEIIGDEKNKNRLLKETLDNQVHDLHKVRERYQQQLTKAEAINEEQLDLLQEQFELEAKLMVESETKDLKERLEMRESELFHRDEHIASLRAELEALHQRQQVLADDEDNLLEKMVNHGVTFMVDFPGKQQLTIPLEKMLTYLDAPLQYIADYCDVDVAIYKQWLYHMELPACNAQLENGQICGKPIAKVEKPKKFVPG